MFSLVKKEEAGVCCCSEDLARAKVDDHFNGTMLRQQVPNTLTIVGAKKFIQGYEPEDTAFVQQLHAALYKHNIDIIISSLGRRIVLFIEFRIQRCHFIHGLYTNIGRVSDYNIKNLPPLLSGLILAGLQKICRRTLCQSNVFIRRCSSSSR